VVRECLQPSREVSELVMSVCARAIHSNSIPCKRPSAVRWLADAAVRALIEEANLTPKPGLVDARDSGAHPDMNLEMLYRSACSLRATFTAIADKALEAEESTRLRENLSELGRRGERIMLQVTGGINTHRGAIWTLGLLCAGAAMLAGKETSAEMISAQAKRIARLPDSHKSYVRTHGQQAAERYGVRGARGEAEGGFRHVVEIGLPTLKKSRFQGLTEVQARLNALLAIMAELDDTCLLHRGGIAALLATKRGARKILDLGVATPGGFRALEELDRRLLELHASPGGSADLLAAVLFLDFIEGNPAFLEGDASGNIAF
jgi:triphosphoribosyl-dephospho-CoA synthase